MHEKVRMFLNKCWKYTKLKIKIGFIVNLSIEIILDGLIRIEPILFIKISKRYNRNDTFK